MNRHTGELRAILTQLAPDRYEGFFLARYMKFLTVCYTVELRLNQSEYPCAFEGEANLGSLAGGVYQYRGTIDPRRFFSTYRCSYDFGILELHPA